MKLVKSSVLSLTVGVLLSGCLGTSNFPEPVDAPKVEESASVNKLWEKKLSRNFDESTYKLTPAVEGKNVFVVNDEGEFFSLDLETGKENYEVELHTPITAGVTLAGNYAYVVSKKGVMIAIRQADGEIMWRTPLGAKALAKPTFAENMLVVRTIDGTISALDPAEGLILWRFHDSEPALTLQGTSAPLIGGGVVINVMDSGMLTILNNKGLPLLNTRIAFPKGSSMVGRMVDQDSDMKVNNGLLFASAYQNMIYALNLSEGAKVVWTNSFSSTIRDFAIDMQDVFIVTEVDEIVALDQRTGQEKWRNKELFARRLSPTVAIPGKVGVVDYQGYLYWLDASTGRILSKNRIAKIGSAASALVLPDRIIWQMDDGRVISFKP